MQAPQTTGVLLGSSANSTSRIARCLLLRSSVGRNSVLRQAQHGAIDQFDDRADSTDVGRVHRLIEAAKMTGADHGDRSGQRRSSIGSKSRACLRSGQNMREIVAVRGHQRVEVVAADPALDAEAGGDLVGLTPAEPAAAGRGPVQRIGGKLAESADRAEFAAVPSPSGHRRRRLSRVVP